MKLFLVLLLAFAVEASSFGQFKLIEGHKGVVLQFDGKDFTDDDYKKLKESNASDDSEKLKELRSFLKTLSSDESQFFPQAGNLVNAVQLACKIQTAATEELNKESCFSGSQSANSKATEKKTQPTFSGTIASKTQIMKGVNQSFRIVDSNGNEFFMKRYVPPKEIVILGEVGASKLGAYLTGGLVPICQGIENNHALIQPFINFDSGKTKELFGDDTFNPKRLSPKQQEQLFAHMVTDHLLRNYDAHTGQFGVDAEGNVIGYDKGQANKWDIDYFRNSYMFTPPHGFDPDTHWSTLPGVHPTYEIFSRYLKSASGQADLRRIIYSSTVQETFKRAEQLSREQATTWMGPYFEQGVKESKTSPDQFYGRYMSTFKSARSDIFKYYDLNQ